jgi:hypothetical protein
MLAVLQTALLEQLPAEVQCAEGQDVSVLPAGDALQERFRSLHPEAITGQAPKNMLAYAPAPGGNSRSIQFAADSECYCVFSGYLENLAQLLRHCGMPSKGTEAQLVVELYKAWRDRRPYTAHQLLSDLVGRFSFILLDNRNDAVFFATDPSGMSPFFWGRGREKSLVLSNEAEMIKYACGKSFAPFPKGCYFCCEGLHSFEHPRRELKPVPHVDSKGQLCGTSFKLDNEPGDAGKKKSGGWMASF